MPDESPPSRPAWVLWAWLGFAFATILAGADLYWLSQRERAALAQAQAAAMRAHPPAPVPAPAPPTVPPTPAKPQP